jgi:hypothetical protein
MIEYEFHMLVKGYTRVPNGWRSYVVGTLDHAEQKTDDGMLLSVRTNLKSELDRFCVRVSQERWSRKIAWIRAQPDGLDLEGVRRVRHVRHVTERHRYPVRKSQL